MIEVRNPWTNDVLGEVPEATAADVARDITHKAEQRVPVLTTAERVTVLERAAELLAERREAFAATICAEAGKPIALARAEVDRACITFQHSALEAARLAEEPVPLDSDSHRAHTEPRPIGVVGAITPFNFPLNLSVHKLGPAIAAGCPIVHKPASATALTALLLRDLLYDAGLPEEQLSTVCGSGGTVGDAIVTHPELALVSFTGSAPVGWAMPARVHRARVALELGNVTPVIVTADAVTDSGERERIATDIARAATGFAGQSCISVQRVFIAVEAYDDFSHALAGAVESIAVGAPEEDTTHCGPVIDAHAAQRVRAVIAATTSEGAEVLARASVPAGLSEHQQAVLVAPMLLAAVPEHSEFMTQELFGPALAIAPFADLDDAVQRANSTRFGLQAGVFSADSDNARSIASRLDFGGVTINEVPTWRADEMPYGGVKDSGNTREGPAWAVRAMTERRLVVTRVTR